MLYSRMIIMYAQSRRLTVERRKTTEVCCGVVVFAIRDNDCSMVELMLL
jgi:hypothetical protein